MGINYMLINIDNYKNKFFMFIELTLIFAK
jgi:hypothetical protein